MSANPKNPSTRPARSRGRPFAEETCLERAQGEAFEVVLTAKLGRSHTAAARQADRKCRCELLAAGRLLDDLEAGLPTAEPYTAAIRGRLIRAIAQDDVENGHVYGPALICHELNQAHGRAIAGLVDADGPEDDGGSAA